LGWTLRARYCVQLSSLSSASLVLVALPTGVRWAGLGMDSES